MGYYSDIQKRRQQKLSQLRKVNGKPNASFRFQETDVENRIKMRFYMKIAISAVLFIFIYFAFQSNQPYAQFAQKYTKEALTREYNFNGLYNWYQSMFEGNPAILPAFTIKQKEDKNSYNFDKPISGLPKQITKINNGILILTKEIDPIFAIDKGIISFVGKDEQLGKIISVRHQNGYESTYGMLGEIDVFENEWVESGQKLGIIDNEFYFALKNQEEFVNPLEVISFD